MLDTLQKKPVQFALFDQTPFVHVPTLYERIVFAPPDFQKTRYRIAGGGDPRIGHLLGNIMAGEEEGAGTGGYLVAIEFEDGSIEAFHPFSLFPVIEKEV